MNPHKVEALDALFTRAVVDGTFPGVAAVVANGVDVLYERAFGARNISTGEPMEIDSLHGIASMTKLPAVIVLMQLVEQGYIELSTPVGDVLPEYDELPLLSGFDASGEPVYRSPDRRGTVLNLVTHTAGLGHPVWNAKLARLFALYGRDGSDLLGTAKAVSLPLVAEPGTAFDYGMGMDWAGLVIEKLTGLPFERRLEEAVLRPLGLSDTVVERSREQLSRAAAVHVRDHDGRWAATGMTYYPAGLQPEVYSAGACLYSTPRDYLRLQQTLLGRGKYRGAELLRPDTVDAMFQNQIGDIDVGLLPTTNPAASADVLLQGWKWGLGILVSDGSQAAGDFLAGGGWAGGWNTFYWVDPQRDIALGMYTQTLPFYDSRTVRVYHEFVELIASG